MEVVNQPQKYWINSPNHGHFKDLEVYPKERCDLSQSSFDKFISFDSKEEANYFLLKLKIFIKDNYIGAKDWFPELNQTITNE